MTETRAEKAQRLVDEEAVYIIFRSDVCVEGRVGRNEQGRGYHTFVYSDGTAHCNCRRGAAGVFDHFRTDDLCVHAEAVKLVMLEESPRGEKEN